MPVICSARSGELAVAAALLASGLFFASQAWLLPIGSLAKPGPGLFPLILGSLLSLLAIAVAVHIGARPANAEPVELGHRDVLIVFAGLLSVSIMFETLGAYLSLGAFAFILLVLIARLSVPRALAGSVIGMGIVHLFFERALGLQLPAGPF